MHHLQQRSLKIVIVKGKVFAEITFLIIFISYHLCYGLQIIDVYTWFIQRNQNRSIIISEIKSNSMNLHVIHIFRIVSDFIFFKRNGLVIDLLLLHYQIRFFTLTIFSLVGCHWSDGKSWQLLLLLNNFIIYNARYASLHINIALLWQDCNIH